MDDLSLARSKYNCTYHIIFILEEQYERDCIEGDSGK